MGGIVVGLVFSVTIWGAVYGLALAYKQASGERSSKPVRLVLAVVIWLVTLFFDFMVQLVLVEPVNGRLPPMTGLHALIAAIIFYSCSAVREEKGASNELARPAAPAQSRERFGSPNRAPSELQGTLPLEVGDAWPDNLHFSEAELAVYGFHQLDVLEQVLRDSNTDRLFAIRNTIGRKIGRLHGAENDRAWLEAYCRQLREYLDAGDSRGRS